MNTIKLRNTAKSGYVFRDFVQTYSILVAYENDFFCHLKVVALVQELSDAPSTCV